MVQFGIFFYTAPFGQRIILAAQKVVGVGQTRDQKYEAHLNLFSSGHRVDRTKFGLDEMESRSIALTKMFWDCVYKSCFFSLK